MKTMSLPRVIGIAILSALALFGILQIAQATNPVVNPLSTNNFSVLAGSTITNTGGSTITGDLGLSPGTSITGFPPGTSGMVHVADSVATQAKTDLVVLFDEVSGKLPVTTIPTELGGSILKASSYVSDSGTFQLTGAVTLDAEGDPDALFIIKTHSTLTTAGLSEVKLINGANPCNVYWRVGSSATLGEYSKLKGNILAMTSVTLTTGAKVDGRVHARTGAVTLDTNTINSPTCKVVATPTPTPTPTPGNSTGSCNMNPIIGTPTGEFYTENGKNYHSCRPHGISTPTPTPIPLPSPLPTPKPPIIPCLDGKCS